MWHPGESSGKAGLGQEAGNITVYQYDLHRAIDEQ